MHILKSNSLPTTCSYIYIYTIPYIPLINNLAISYAFILPIYYLHALYLLSMRYLHKTYILSKYYLEAIYRIYILSIYYLYATYTLSYISTTYLISVLSYVFLHIIYINTFFSIYLYISSILLSCVNIAPTHRTAPTHREQGKGRERESPLYARTYIPTVYVSMFVYIYIHISILYLHTYPTGGRGRSPVRMYLYELIYVGIITTFVPIYDHLSTGGGDPMYPATHRGGDHHYLLPAYDVSLY